MAYRRLLVVLVLVGCAQPRPFRLSEDGARLEARVVTLRDAEGREVVVPAMLHIAEPAFYAEVGGRVGRCDVVFGEGVRSERAQPATVASSATSSIDTVMQALVGPATRRYPLIAAHLGLTVQPPLLPGTRADRLRNADMTWGELLKVLTPEERAGLNIRAADAAAEPPSEADLALAGLTTLATITRETRAELAQGLASGDEPDIDLPTLAGERERRVAEAALRALEEPGVRRVAIVYGGGHQRGLAELLEARGFEPAAEVWVRVFAVDDVAGARLLPFAVDDIVVVRGPDFELELAWAEPVTERLAAVDARGEPLGELEQLLLLGARPTLLVRVRDAAGAAVERPLHGGPVEVAPKPTGATEVGAMVATSAQALVVRGRPIGALMLEAGLPSGWAISIKARGSLLGSLALEPADDDDQPWRLRLPEGRPHAGGLQVEVLTGANQGGGWLERLGR